MDSEGLNLMFFCDKCAEQNNWPQSVVRSRGRCEVCGEVAVCYDMPCSCLPKPEDKKPEEEAKDNQPKFIRKGQCKRCGDCCTAFEYPGVGHDAEFMLMHGARWVNGMWVVNLHCVNLCADYRGQVSCRVYEEGRPPICVGFPEKPEDVRGLDSCGYWFEEVER